MDPETVLESLAREKGVVLTHLSEINSKYSRSAKVACCGGLMTRLVTESAADSTVLLRDGSGSCYCALHGDITNRYPDVLTTDALLFFTDITVLVISSKVPPMLIACLQNLAGLLLPDKATSAAAGATASRSAAAAGTRPAPACNLLVRGSVPHNDDSARSDTWHSDPLTGRQRGCDAVDTFNDFDGAGDSYMEPHASVGAVLSAQRTLDGQRHDSVPAEKRVRTENTTASAAFEVDDEDDAECLELVDGM
ncbi:Domain of unknown function (DUF4539) [Leishmania donovani]|uniref:Domain_of_uncharacterized_function_(DUF4539)_-_pu tative n=3 Tax=Leishmania donovani species complex TaxID=38574 RepID=A0A6L0XSP5_LEIIN|nr:conserved hypothetical protein [Leishmania infantum JPCM5]TPP40559.1 hypothetical protein CGC20_13720 [Leishmania donovani]CAC9502281.1 Domain_of_uncharacterised_function_(DUF4539)_-_putative [Leishmania infantum]CAJ1990214.1 Domain of unknown function (DUF4539) [Leishmania donovani]CAM69299.1 conserved hypothetical protein [Leishmania infantum JPCM5]SUZ43235.1 Domain_of_uncharacterised_function_(DUF4539)_-_putative [Leishmania infantum]|eukprot:XP_001470107.1 conserved hypothetical protein [Leishmania infantum JPCM5]